MAISISNTVPATQPVGVPGSPNGQTRPAVVARPSTDTVKLSQSGQIHAMRQQGQPAAQIANFLGVTLASVNSVLGITVAKAAVPADSVSSTPPAPPAAPVGVQAGPVPAAQPNVAKG